MVKRACMVAAGTTVLALAGCAVSTSQLLSARAAEPAELSEPMGVLPAPAPAPAARPAAQPWNFMGIAGQEIATRNFVVYTTLRSTLMLDRIPVFYEGCMDHYTTWFGELPQPPQRLTAFIFQDKRQWQNKTREILPDQADTFMSLGRGGFTTQGTAVLYDIGPSDTWAIAAHEGWHQYTQATFKHHLPVWLEEGIATYMEAIGFRRDGGLRLRPWNNRERREALRRAVSESDLIPLPELLSRSPQAFLSSGKDRLLVYYAQVWALCRFLSEGMDRKYRPRLEEVLSDAAEGRLVGRLAGSRVLRTNRRTSVSQLARSGPAVLLEYFNPDMAAIEREYLDYLATLATTRGPERTVQARPPAATAAIE
jgi:hypothetical protein